MSRCRAARPEAIVEGRPALTIADADREAIAEALADLLIAAADAADAQHPEDEPDHDAGWPA